MRKIGITFILFSIIIAAIGISASAQGQVDAEGLGFSYQRSIGVAVFSAATRNSEGGRIYSGTGSFSLPLFDCVPCSIPNTFNTNGFPAGGELRINSGGNTEIIVKIREAQSDPIVLRPSLRRKTPSYTFGGNTRLTGSLEVWQNGVLFEFDDAIEFTGLYTAFFLNRNALDGRKVEFIDIRYTLSQVNNNGKEESKPGPLLSILRERYPHL